LGAKITKITFVPGKNEQIETTVNLQKESRSVIHGIVLDERKCPVKDAVVKLFELPNKENCCYLVPITHTFTDECGQFLFGPLAPCKRYVVKVWHNRVKTKMLPAKPFVCKNPCPRPPQDSSCHSGYILNSEESVDNFSNDYDILFDEDME
jgi:hypothetical protein